MRFVLLLLVCLAGPLLGQPNTRTTQPCHLAVAEAVGSDPWILVSTNFPDPSGRSQSGTLLWVNQHFYTLTDTAVSPGQIETIATPVKVSVPMFGSPVSIAYHRADGEPDRIFVTDNRGKFQASAPYFQEGAGLTFSAHNSIPLEPSDVLRRVRLAHGTNGYLHIYLSSAAGRIFRATLSNEDRVEGTYLPAFKIVANKAPGPLIFPYGDEGLVSVDDQGHVFLFEDGRWDWRVQFPEPLIDISGYEIPEELHSEKRLHQHVLWGLGASGRLYRWSEADSEGAEVKAADHPLPEKFKAMSLSAAIGIRHNIDVITQRPDAFLRRLGRQRIEKVVIAGVATNGEARTYEIAPLSYPSGWKFPQWEIVEGKR